MGPTKCWTEPGVEFGVQTRIANKTMAQMRGTAADRYSKKSYVLFWYLCVCQTHFGRPKQIVGIVPSRRGCELKAPKRLPVGSLALGDAGHFARPKSGSKVLTISDWLFVYHNTKPPSPPDPPPARLPRFRCVSTVEPIMDFIKQMRLAYWLASFASIRFVSIRFGSVSFAHHGALAH